MVDISTTMRFRTPTTLYPQSNVFFEHLSPEFLLDGLADARRVSVEELLANIWRWCSHVQAYYIFSVGNLMPIWTEEHPDCWKVRPIGLASVT